MLRSYLLTILATQLGIENSRKYEYEENIGFGVLNK